MSESATDAAAGVTFYWRPGCGFCMRLERQLGRVGLPLDMHNIWEDPAAAKTVRSIANGNETVPTVVVGPVQMVNPSADEVLAAVAAHVPHLTPRESPARRRRLGGNR